MTKKIVPTNHSELGLLECWVDFQEALSVDALGSDISKLPSTMRVHLASFHRRDTPELQILWLKPKFPSPPSICCPQLSRFQAPSSWQCVQLCSREENGQIPFIQLIPAKRWGQWEAHFDFGEAQVVLVWSDYLSELGMKSWNVSILQNKNTVRKNKAVDPLGHWFKV